MIATIKNIIKKLRSDTGINVIRANGMGDMPSVPYATYNITSPYIKGTGREEVTYINNIDDITLQQDEEFRVTLSINAFGATDDEAVNLAVQIRKWFSFLGEDYLTSLNVVLIEAAAIQNRTTFLVDSYEYKHGFDVQLRMTDTSSKNIDYFNQVETGME